MPESFEPRRDTDPSRSTSSRFVKVSRTADHDARIQREAALLKTLRHPGIVTFLAADTAAFPNILVTERIDGPSLAEAGPLPVAEAERLVTAVRATLADLHHVGVVHGAIAPEHVLVRPDGRPVLCSFGYAGRIGDPAPPLPPALAAFAHPRRAETGLTPEVDLYALDEVARGLVTPQPAAAGAPPISDPTLRRPAVPESGNRPRVPLLVGALGGAALLAAVAVWGLTRRTGTDPPGPRAAVATTVPVPSINPGRSDPTAPRGDIGTAPGGTTSPATESGETPSRPDGPGGTYRPGIRRGADSSRSSIELALGGAAPEAPEQLPADAEPPCPPEAPEGTAPPSPSAAGWAPVPEAVPPRAGQTAPAQREAPVAGREAPSAPTPLPIPSTSLPPPPLPSPAALAPPASLPPPDSLPAGVTLPDPATLVPPVELPAESTLEPPPAPPVP